MERGGAKQYELFAPRCSKLPPLVDDIGHFTFGGGCSVVFSALQFMLYTGVSDFKLVGCDSTQGVSFSPANSTGASKTSADPNVPLLKMWQYAADFIKQYYPNVSGEVVNPVALSFSVVGSQVPKH